MSKDGKTSKVKGALTEEEILSQPKCWKESLRQLEESRKLEELAGQFAAIREWIFVGCGSSYYVALSAASTMAELTGLRARALPASEILLFPDQFSADDTTAAVLISRSGRTSEVLRVAEQLSARGIATLGISCAPEQALEKLVTTAIVLPAADERSTVMTRSFTSMLLALQAFAATIGKQIEFRISQRALSANAEALMRILPGRVQEFVDRHSFEDYVFLGQGALYGIACESALKLTEMSLSYAQSFHTLEFRHGPKSIVSPRTMIGFLLAEKTYAEELAVLEEIKGLGGTTVVIANRPEKRARAAADLVVELVVDAPDVARLPLYLLTGQLMGLYTGTKKDLDPDTPRNLSRVVVLDGHESREETKHAAL